MLSDRWLLLNRLALLGVLGQHGVEIVQAAPFSVVTL